MKLTRGTALAALLLVALAAPVAAYSLSDDGGDADEPTAAVTKTKSAKPDKPDKAEHKKGTHRADEASAAGRAHAEAMRAWAQCVAEAARGPKADDAPTPPKLACGDKPLGPGRAKHLAANGGVAPGRSGEHKPKTHDKSGSNGR